MTAFPLLYSRIRRSSLSSRTSRASSSKRGNGVRKVVVEDLKNGEQKTLVCDGVFIFAGRKPNLGQIAPVFTLDPWGYINTDAQARTNLNDVFAVGDVAAKHFRQITTAVSDGTVAAITVSKELEV